MPGNSLQLIFHSRLQNKFSQSGVDGTRLHTQCTKMDATHTHVHILLYFYFNFIKVSQWNLVWVVQYSTFTHGKFCYCTKQLQTLWTNLLFQIIPLKCMWQPFGDQCTCVVSITMARVSLPYSADGRLYLEIKLQISRRWCRRHGEILGCLSEVTFPTTFLQ